MALLTKDKIKEIINNAPKNTTPAGIVAALRQQGHQLEGYPTELVEPKKESSLFDNIQKFGEATFGRAGRFMFGSTAKTVGGMVAGGVGAGMKLTQKPELVEKGKKLEKIAEETITPMNVGLTALELTTFGLGKGFTKIAVSPLTKMAKTLYTKALKPRGKMAEKAVQLAETGLKEKIWLTQGGVEKAASKINELEMALGDTIKSAAKQGITISTKGLKSYVDEAKKLFTNIFDDKAAQKAVKEIDDITKSFLKRYGNELPIDIAQKIKVNTHKVLRKYYGEMSGAKIEAQKAGVRFLKEKIVEKAPKAGDINKRLGSLYEFDKALDKAAGRMKNLNLLGLGVKFGAAAGGIKGAVIGKLVDLADAPAIKSGLAIGLNQLAKGGGKVGETMRVPVALVIKNLISYFQEED